MTIRTGCAFPGDNAASIDVTAFVAALHDRALEIANSIYDPAAYELVPLEAAARLAAVTFYLRRRAWAEWYFGTVTPARQITMLPESEIDLRLRLARQIADELRHYSIFSKLAASRGGETRLTEFVSPATLLAMHGTQAQLRTAAELAASNQFSGEIVLSVQARSDANVLLSL